MANRVKLEICGASYALVTNESPEYVQSLGQELESAVRELMERNSRLSINEALVLCAVNCLDGYNKSERSADNMRTQLAEYLEDAAKARMELDDARREIDRLRRELELRK